MLILRGHDGRSKVESLAFLPDSGSLVSAATDRTVLLWDMTTAKGRCLDLPINRDPREPYYPWVAYSPDGKQLAYANWGEGIILCRLDTGKTRRLSDEGGPVQFSPDGRLLATVNNRRLGIWDGQKWRGFNFQMPSGMAAHSLAFSTQSLAFSPDGKSVATGHYVIPSRRSWNHWIRLTDTATGKEQTRFVGYGDVVNSLAFSPDGYTLAAGCGQFLWVWSVFSANPVARCTIDRLHFQAVAFTADGRFLAAVRNDGIARFYDASSWQERFAFDWKIGPLVSLAFSRDGMLAAAGSKRGKIVVWDVDF
jgi:WD40 repeat protein